MRKIISLKTVTFSSKEEQQFTIDSPTAAQPLIEPTSTTLSYGSCDNIISEGHQTQQLLIQDIATSTACSRIFISNMFNIMIMASMHDPLLTV